MLASACRYDLAGVLEGEPTRICGIGDVLASPNEDASHLGQLATHLIGDAEREGVDLAFAPTSLLLPARSGHAEVEIQRDSDRRDPQGRGKWDPGG